MARHTRSLHHGPVSEMGTSQTTSNPFSMGEDLSYRVPRGGVQLRLSRVWCLCPVISALETSDRKVGSWGQLGLQ